MNPDAVQCVGTLRYSQTTNEVGVCMRPLRVRISVVVVLALTLAALALLAGSTSFGASSREKSRDEIMIPATDQFVPYHLRKAAGHRGTRGKRDTDGQTPALGAG